MNNISNNNLPAIGVFIFLLLFLFFYISVVINNSSNNIAAAALFLFIIFFIIRIINVNVYYIYKAQLKTICYSNYIK